MCKYMTDMSIHSFISHFLNAVNIKNIGLALAAVKWKELFPCLSISQAY